jgi:hypothetical protein
VGNQSPYQNRRRIYQKYYSALIVVAGWEHYMVTGDLKKKNIAIRLDIYEKLLDMKHGKDTFSDVIERHVLRWEGKDGE